MSSGRPAEPGKTRNCPHCKATILESHSICPGCHHHLRFDSQAAQRQLAARTALRVEGTIRGAVLEDPTEYCLVLSVRNDRGEEVTRQVVSVGALQPGEKRTFSVAVDTLPATARVAPAATTAAKPATPAASRSAATGQRSSHWSTRKL